MFEIEMLHWLKLAEIKIFVLMFYKYIINIIIVLFF